MHQPTSRVILVGLGLHAKRIYLHFLRTNGCLPLVIVDLASNQHSIESYLSANGLEAEFLSVPDEERDLSHLSPSTEGRLRQAITKHSLNKAIISTEPKGHLAYGRFFLENQVDVLIDKPISAPVGACSHSAAAEQIYHDYAELRDLASRHPGTRCVVQCQRRYHDGYRQAKEILREVISHYEVPLTHLYTYHSDGLWNMPNEYRERENHPYKYGYGKLMHSGYHFVDVFAWLAELNWLLPDKRPDTVELFEQSCDPNDCLFQIDRNNYARLFGPEEATRIFNGYIPSDYSDYGEVDSYTQLQLKKGDRVVTSGGIHLLQNGFSRRSWTRLPEDTYKGNGRVRHEHLNVQVGPLLNLQIHSYESHEIRDQEPEAIPYELGGLEHFELVIFRNKAVIGGRAIERYRLNSRDEEKEYLGHNEAAREAGLRDFLSSSSSAPVSEVGQHELTNFLLSSLHQARCLRRAGEIPYLKGSLPSRDGDLMPAEYSRTYAGSSPRESDL